MTLNKAMIIGNLTRDPELKNTSSGANVASFSVATSLVWNDANGQKQQKPEFHNIIAWRRLAEICGQYLRKGSKVFIEGRLQTTDWTGQDGVKRYRTEIVAENMIMLDSKNSNRNDSGDVNNLREELKEIQIEEEPEEEIRVENIPF
ncbi:single-stranded DNA-binding protein [Candidatus Falkowbacteria bacterium]|jgi:single-strand DNA-binding protein|nr:single-stranded DNA-binding protein [Patescibacteria group bacterium]MDD3435276.1 single-stranded DNA-binding protein [Patescibacteria group bacterium]MDD4466439.1 single-stranded DNA-binding protein [Patescibacteria group bacterium]NCU43233.1 single-stranded DNA-binding protein [Candidatus Falkowbacteria bacterium]